MLYIKSSSRATISQIVGDITSIEQLVTKYNKCLINYNKKSSEIFNEMYSSLRAENCGKIIINILQSINDREVLDTFECIINLLTYNKKICYPITQMSQSGGKSNKALRVVTFRT